MYLAYGQLVYVVAHRVLGRDDLAEEATRLTFVRAWQAAAGLDIHRDPAPWLARIAKRSAIDIYRREARNAEPAVTPMPAEGLDAVWKIRRVIDVLPPAERTVLELLHRDGLTEAEIAARLGLPLDTVGARDLAAPTVSSRGCSDNSGSRSHESSPVTATNAPRTSPMVVEGNSTSGSRPRSG